jgi:WD40 repeat protein
MARSSLIALLFCTFVGSSGCHFPLGSLLGNDAQTTAPEQASTWHRIDTSQSQTIQAHTGEVLALREIAQSPTQLLTAGSDGNLVAWALPDGSASIVKSLGGPIQLAALGESRAMVAWTSGFTVHVACLDGCSKQWDLSDIKARTTSVAFHEDDSALLIGGADGRVYRWRFATTETAEKIRDKEKILERYIAHQTIVSNVASLPGARAFFSTDWDGSLYGWLSYTSDDQQGEYDKNLFGGRFFGTGGTFIRANRLPDRGITALAVSQDGEQLALGTDDGFVEVWQVRGFEMIARAQLHTGRITSVSIDSAQARVVSVGRDGKLVACHIDPDPLFKIKPGALADTLTPILDEEMNALKSVYVLSSGDAIVTTTSGQLGEFKLTALSKPSITATPSPTLKKQGAVDSDY